MALGRPGFFVPASGFAIALALVDREGRDRHPGGGGGMNGGGISIQAAPPYSRAVPSSTASRGLDGVGSLQPGSGNARAEEEEAARAEEDHGGWCWAGWLWPG